MEQQTRKQRIKPAALIICGVVAALALLASGYWRTLNAVPQIRIPSHPMPSPNARDFFIKAGNSIVDESKVGWAINSRHTGRNQYDHPYTTAEKVALVQENAQALRTLREGFKYPYQEMPARSFNTLFPYIAKFRGIARLLRLEAQARAERGDWYGALNSDLDCIQLGQMIPRGGHFLGVLVGIAIQDIGQRGLKSSNAISHLTASQARAAAQRAERIIELHVPYADVLQEQKWYYQAGLLELFRSPNWHAELQNLVGEEGSIFADDPEDKRSRMEKLKELLKLYFINKREVMHSYADYMDQIIANARQPYAAHLPDPPVPDDPVNQVLSLDFTRIRGKDVQYQSQLAQLAIRLALQACYLDHHHYPPTLNALLPTYLQKLPDDPTAMQGSFSYTRDKTGYTLSEGGRMKDEG